MSDIQQAIDSINSFMQFFVTPWAAFIAFLIGLAGLGVGVATLKYKKPSYLTRNFTIISNPYEKSGRLEILFSGERVEKLTISRIAFFNNGRDVIRKDDIVSRNPLRIELRTGIKIFEHKVIYVRDCSTGFDIREQDKNTYLIEFDYLEKDDGGIIQLVHSGGRQDISLDGQIIGAKKVFNLDGLFDESIGFMHISMWLMTLFFAVGFLVELVTKPEASNKPGYFFIGLVFIFGALTLSKPAIGAMIGKLDKNKRNYLRKLNQEWEV